MKEKIKLLEIYLKAKDQALFLDIETEGLSKEKNAITLIGICKNDRYLVFVKDHNLEKAFPLLASTPIWITFGGKNFDLPFIKKTFSELSYLNVPKFHLDLYEFTPLVGLKGGLKKIEKELGISRKTEGINGYDAVKLWQKWEKERDRKALRTLIHYNKEDVLNLKIILDYIIERVFAFKGE